MARKMRLALALRGYSSIWTEAHRSKLVNKSLIAQKRVVFYFDAGNIARLLKVAPEYRKKYVCLAEFLTPPEKRIPDPGFMKADSPEFERVVDMIVAACNGLIRKILQEL
jgi:protein-tyrosine-phosphatase